MYEICYPRYTGHQYGPHDLVEAAEQAVFSLKCKLDFVHDMGYVPEYEAPEIRKLKGRIREYYQDMFDFHTMPGFLPKEEYNIIVCPSCGIVCDKNRLWFKEDYGLQSGPDGPVRLAKCILCGGFIREDHPPLAPGEYMIHPAGTGPLADEVQIHINTFTVGGEPDTLDQIEMDLAEEEALREQANNE